jgi:hypothetical protein
MLLQAAEAAYVPVFLIELQRRLSFLVYNRSGNEGHPGGAVRGMRPARWKRRTAPASWYELFATRFEL